MGARSVARVVVSIGMMNIGIKLFLSAKGEQVSFRMINPETGNLVGQKLVDKGTGEEVNRGDTVKGYEYAKDKFVTFSDEEIANMAAEKRDTLELTEFVPVSNIDPLHVEKTFYTGPDKGMDKAYKLLFKTLLSEKKAAVGTWVARGKEHLVMIRAYDHGLIMHQMFYDSEVRAFDNTCDNISLSPDEIAIGKVLVKQFTKKTFDKSQYSDKYAERIAAAVETKLAGGDITTVTSNASKNNSSLEDSLRASLVAMGVADEDIDARIAEALAEVGSEEEAVAAPPEPPSEPKKPRKRASKKKTAAK